MRIKEHWPEIVQEIREFQYIDLAQDPEFKAIKSDANTLTEVILVSTAPEVILSRYEKILGLEAEQDIGVRRSNILNKLSNRTPFTLGWLKEKLNTLLGVGNYTLYVDGVGFEVVIEVDIAYGHIFSSVQTQFIKQIPANMLLTPKLKITAPVGAGCLSKAYRFDPPICEYLTGIYPYTSCLGKVDEHIVSVFSKVDGYLFDPDLVGTIPDISTIGKMDIRNMTIDKDICEYLFDPDLTGTIPDTDTIGKIACLETRTTETRGVIPFTQKLCNTVKCGM